MENAKLEIVFRIATKKDPEAHVTRLSYNGMDAAQIAQFELDLLEAFTELHKKWMAQGGLTS